MMIKKVGYDELGEVLELQYRAYRSEAELLGDFDIPPLRQTLAEVQEEWEKGVILKAVDESGEMIGSVRGYVEEGTLYVGKLVVAPEFRGRGIGTKLQTGGGLEGKVYENQKL